MLRVAFILFAVAHLASANGSARIALTSLCDPAEIATLESERGANPRVRRIAYWLEVARQNGRDPKAEMDAVMTQLLSFLFLEALLSLHNCEVLRINDGFRLRYVRQDSKLERVMQKTISRMTLLCSLFLCTPLHQTLALEIQGGESIETPFDVSSLSTDELRSFFAFRFLRGFVREGAFTLAEGGITERVRLCREHLMSNLYQGGGSDVFDKKRSEEKLIKEIEDPSGLAAKAAAVKFITVDVSDWIDRDYDFESSSFAIKRNPDSFSPRDEFNILSFDNATIPSGADVAERWTKSWGRLIAICEVGRFFMSDGPLQLSLKAKCHVLRLVLKDGEPVAEIRDIKSIGDIHEDGIGSL